jgi:hypothetical protein
LGSCEPYTIKHSADQPHKDRCIQIHEDEREVRCVRKVWNSKEQHKVRDRE